MKIELLGWGNEGLRCPDVDVQLTEKSGKICPVSLIQMPNGTGKTTTLELLKATLSGEANNWDKVDVQKYALPGKNSVTKGRFRVDLLMDGSPLTSHGMSVSSL